MNFYQIRDYARDWMGSRIGRFTLVVGVGTLLIYAAMQYRADTYPSAWPALATDARNTRSDAKSPQCPDLSGTYALHRPNDKCCGFDQDSTFLTEGVAVDLASPWQTVTISGVAGRALTLTYERSVADQSASAPKQTVIVPYASHYTCDGGWLVGAGRPVFAYPNQGDADQSIRRRVGTLPSYFRKDSQGAMIARADARETLKFAAGGGSRLSVPYWSYVAPIWARWVPTLTPSEAARKSAMNSTTAGAATLESPPATADNVARRSLREGALAGALVNNGEVYVFTLYGETNAAIAATLAAMQADSALTSVALNSSAKNSTGLFEATVRFRLAAAPKLN